MKLINGAVMTKAEIVACVGSKKAKKMCDTLEVFPTPFKGIYYLPFNTERKGAYVTYPYKVIFEAAKKFLRNENLYYGMETALYFERKIWNPVPVHIMNERLSKKIKLKKTPRGYWRSKKKHEIISQYPYPISFHKIKMGQKQHMKFKEGIGFSSFKKTKKDAEYLCKRGSKEACNFIKFYIEKSRPA